MIWLKRLGIAFLVIYILVCIGLYFYQERLMFLPYKLSNDHVFRIGQEVEIPVSDGISLNCLWVKKSNSKGVILYLHGNRGSNRRCLGQARSAFENTNYDIFMPDYRGYGKTEGKIYSEQQMHADIDQVYSFLKMNYKEENIVVVGYSMGSGMATKVVAKNNPKQLFLLAPYYSLVDMKNRYAPFIPNFLLKYHLRNDKNIMQVKCPITIFHGTADEVLPYDSSVKLKVLRPEIELLTLEGTHHRRTIFHPIVNTTIKKYLN